MTAYEFVAQVARLLPVEFPEHESWTDDQAEDSIVTLNRLIEMARNIDHQEEGVP